MLPRRPTVDPEKSRVRQASGGLRHLLHGRGAASADTRTPISASPPGAEFDPPWDTDRSPLGPGGPPLAASAAAALPVADWVFTDAASTKEVG